MVGLVIEFSAATVASYSETQGKSVGPGQGKVLAFQYEPPDQGFLLVREMESTGLAGSAQFTGRLLHLRLNQLDNIKD
jgi:hypothetical protein